MQALVSWISQWRPDNAYHGERSPFNLQVLLLLKIHVLVQNTFYQGHPMTVFSQMRSKHFLGSLEYSVRPLEMHSKRGYKICICSVIHPFYLKTIHNSLSYLEFSSSERRGRKAVMNGHKYTAFCSTPWIMSNAPLFLPYGRQPRHRFSIHCRCWLICFQ